MESYVNWKTSNFYKKTKVWATLNKDELTFYEKLDLEDQKPVGDPRATFSVENAEISGKESKEGQLGVIINTVNDGEIYFKCETTDICSAWLDALKRASALKKVAAGKEAMIVNHKRALQLADNAELSQSIVNKNFKRLSLRHHPDRGGDANQFQVFNEAHKALLAIIERDNEEANATYLRYRVVIEKGPVNVGLGLHVTEDSMGRIAVTSVSPSIIIKEFDSLGTSVTEIKPGDLMKRIENDDTSEWTLLRLKYRVNSTRIPVGAISTFEFERRVVKTDDIDDVISMESPVRGNQENSPTNRHQQSPMNDIDDNRYSRPISPSATTMKPFEANTKENSLESKIMKNENEYLSEIPNIEQITSQSASNEQFPTAEDDNELKNQNSEQFSNLNNYNNNYNNNNEFQRFDNNSHLFAEALKYKQSTQPVSSKEANNKSNNALKPLKSKSENKKNKNSKQSKNKSKHSMKKANNVEIRYHNSNDEINDYSMFDLLPQNLKTFYQEQEFAAVQVQRRFEAMLYNY